MVVEEIRPQENGLHIEVTSGFIGSSARVRTGMGFPFTSTGQNSKTKGRSRSHGSRAKGGVGFGGYGGRVWQKGSKSMGVGDQTRG